jgi:hypothetical protein
MTAPVSRVIPDDLDLVPPLGLNGIVVSRPSIRLEVEDDARNGNECLVDVEVACLLLGSSTYPKPPPVRLFLRRAWLVSIHQPHSDHGGQTS